VRRGTARTLLAVLAAVVALAFGCAGMRAGTSVPDGPGCGPAVEYVPAE
jgi:hypothetical protein